LCILALGFQVRLKWYTVLRTCGSEVHPCAPWRHTGRLLGREAWVEWDRTRRTSHIVLVQRQRSPHGTSRHPPGMRMMSGPTSIDPCLTVFKIELECKSLVCPQAFASQLCELVGPFVFSAPGWIWSLTHSARLRAGTVRSRSIAMCAVLPEHGTTRQHLGNATLRCRHTRRRWPRLALGDAWGVHFHHRPGDVEGPWRSTFKVGVR
jgi:hypothetical protein